MVRENEDRNAVKLICDLHAKDGIPGIGKLPEPWKRVINSQWVMWVNGQMTTQKVAEGFPLEPGGVYVEYNGFPAGSFNMIHRDGDEAIMAAGEAANYSTFCDALEEAIAE